MTERLKSHRIYRFGEFSLDVWNRRLCRGDEVLPLNSKYFDVLLLLINHRGQLVEKQRIFDEVWSEIFVTDAALTQCIKDIRKVLGDDVSHPRFIKTVPKHGYLFIGKLDDADVQDPPLKPPRRPYKSLDYYTEQDAAYFFGREKEIEALCSHILAHRTFILHGRSGVGKSSLLCAGVLPRLKSLGCRAVMIRNLTDPREQWNCAIKDWLNKPNAPASDLEPLEGALEGHPTDTNVVFIFDSFEEFFSHLNEKRKERFIERVGQMTALAKLTVRFVFALREDLLAKMSLFKSILPEIFHHEYRLTRLTRGQAAEAITGPAHLVGCHFEPTLLSRLLDDLADGDGIDPPQLQIVCDTLYDEREGDGTLTLAAYERLGAGSQILAGYLERVLSRFDPPALQLAKNILKLLLSSRGERVAVPMTEILARIKAETDPTTGAVHQLIQDLVASRVVRLRRQDGEAWLELTHDYLVPEVSRWLSQEEAALKSAQEVVTRAVANYRAHHLLIDDAALDLLLKFGDSLGLKEEEADLLIRSVLDRARYVPEWLLDASPSAFHLILEAMKNEDPRIRVRAIEASRGMPPPDVEREVQTASLWDSSLVVRKFATLTLADWFDTEAQTILNQTAQTTHAGIIRGAVSLAFLREQDAGFVSFSKLPPALAALIVPVLIALRLRRGWLVIFRQTVGGTLGGAAAGLAGSTLLGVALGWARHSSFYEFAPLTLVLASLGTLVGAWGGMGVSFGMAAAAQVAYRHSRWWSIAGGAIGGAVVGGAANLLGMDTLQALFGRSPTRLTGAMEGIVLGGGVALGVLFVSQLIQRPRAWQQVFGAAAGAMAAAIVLSLVGGNLFSGSLDVVARAFADSQIRLDPLASFFGEVRYGRTTQIFLGALEGLLFGGGLLAGIEFMTGNRHHRSTHS